MSDNSIASHVGFSRFKDFPPEIKSKIMTSFLWKPSVVQFTVIFVETTQPPDGPEETRKTFHASTERRVALCTSQFDICGGDDCVSIIANIFQSVSKAVCEDVNLMYEGASSPFIKVPCFNAPPYYMESDLVVVEEDPRYLRPNTDLLLLYVNKPAYCPVNSPIAPNHRICSIHPGLQEQRAIALDAGFSSERWTVQEARKLWVYHFPKLETLYLVINASSWEETTEPTGCTYQAFRATMVEVTLKANYRLDQLLIRPQTKPLALDFELARKIDDDMKKSVGRLREGDGPPPRCAVLLRVKRRDSTW